MTLFEILQAAGQLFVVLFKGYIDLSNAHPILGIAGLFGIVGTIIELIKAISHRKG